MPRLSPARFSVRLLLLSNSTQFGRAYLEHAEAIVLDHLEGVDRLLFVPFALADRTGYTAKVRERFADWSIAVDGLHDADDPVVAVREAQAVFIGGGNSFRLLRALQNRGLLGVLRGRVRDGMPYMGASAGSNMACPTIRTTNDMPIVEPAGFAALNLIPFQLNPHYLDPDARAASTWGRRAKRGCASTWKTTTCRCWACARVGGCVRRGGELTTRR